MKSLSECWLIKNGDRFEWLSNLEAIIAADEGGQLEVYPDSGLVTYWYKGEQLSQLRPFIHEEMLAIAAKCDEGLLAFWVEKLDYADRMLLPYMLP